jgi:hypothetical protein
MGDTSMEDDGVALRVMGRIRPLLGEIALIGGPTSRLQRQRRKQSSGVGGRGLPAWLRVAVLPATPEARPRKTKPDSLASLVDWIEGFHSIRPLEPLLEDRRRIILLVAARHGASPGGVHHWHVDRQNKTKLSTVKFYTSVLDDSLDHLPYWMEDDLPEHGTDLIAIEPYRVAPSPELSPVIRSRLSSITAQVGGLLVRILEEEGWSYRKSRTGSRTRRRSRGSSAS